MGYLSFVNFFSSINNVLAVAIGLRLCLVVYAVWHDAHVEVKYVDIDYR